MENVVLGKDFNLGPIGSFFMFSPNDHEFFSKLEKCIWFQ
jgi:hypothetical protein